MSHEIDRPVPFPGTASDARRNYQSHYWLSDGDGEIDCLLCAIRPYHEAADYSCGAVVPRETVPWSKEIEVRQFGRVLRCMTEETTT